ncbi:hypothetical protein DFA_08366 [Cavenderia fasciculata]|uniref:Ankyrin repeat-containing protein n=1 Tax=Cavenderia fasciculata TaxID=261658 RepID=F4Q5W2_CACFS|nr:uncharacterized protein DFA_08366 [Cavenderia fasciculata]EGG17371.1 hypothetical protein DFA_08366 [Cavenderia fasciculata]|eukprot:XP_004355855.1 hypothetical protein DFA_08366 [Cavenderia fasciculata]
MNQYNNAGITINHLNIVFYKSTIAHRNWFSFTYQQKKMTNNINNNLFLEIINNQYIHFKIKNEINEIHQQLLLADRDDRDYSNLVMFPPRIFKQNLVKENAYPFGMNKDTFYLQQYNEWKDAEKIVYYNHLSMLSDKIDRHEELEFSPKSIELICERVVDFKLFLKIYHSQQSLFTLDNLLYYSCIGGNLDIVKLLLNQSTPCVLSRYQLHTASIIGGHQHILKYLIKTGVINKEIVQEQMDEMYYILLENIVNTKDSIYTIQLLREEYPGLLESHTFYNYLVVVLQDFSLLVDGDTKHLDNKQYKWYRFILTYIHNMVPVQQQIQYIKFIYTHSLSGNMSAPNGHDHSVILPERTTGPSLDEYVESKRLELQDRHPNHIPGNDYLTSLLIQHLYAYHFYNLQGYIHKIATLELQDQQVDVEKVMPLIVEQNTIIFGEPRWEGLQLFHIINLQQTKWIIENRVGNIDDFLIQLTYQLISRTDSNQSLQILKYLFDRYPRFMSGYDHLDGYAGSLEIYHLFGKDKPCHQNGVDFFGALEHHEISTTNNQQETLKLSSRVLNQLSNQQIIQIYLESNNPTYYLSYSIINQRYQLFQLLFNLLPLDHVDNLEPYLNLFNECSHFKSNFFIKLISHVQCQIQETNLEKSFHTIFQSLISDNTRFSNLPIESTRLFIK